MNYREFVNNTISALKPDKQGFSVKKLIAAYGSILLMLASIPFIYIHPEYFVPVLGIWIGYFGALLGIAAYEKKNDLQFNQPTVETNVSTEIINSKTDGPEK